MWTSHVYVFLADKFLWLKFWFVTIFFVLILLRLVKMAQRHRINKKRAAVCEIRSESNIWHTKFVKIWYTIYIFHDFSFLIFFFLALKISYILSEWKCRLFTKYIFYLVDLPFTRQTDIYYYGDIQIFSVYCFWIKGGKTSCMCELDSKLDLLEGFTKRLNSRKSHNFHSYLPWISNENPFFSWPTKLVWWIFRPAHLAV